jgi:hypothetical protein
VLAREVDSIATPEPVDDDEAFVQHAGALANIRLFAKRPIRRIAWIAGTNTEDDAATR